MSSETLSTRSLPESATYSWLAVVRAYNLCDAVLTQRLAALGVRIGEHEVLANLLRSPGMTQQQLAERCFVAKSGVSMLITRMEQQALVTRESDAIDARVKRLSLTKKGLKLARATHAIQVEVVTAMVDGASETEIAVVTGAMQRASLALERMLQPG
jgi:DNA-binding MarR family transcriptional regulator